MNAARLVCTVTLCAVALSAAEEIQTNVRTAGNQCNPTVSLRNDGGFVIAWSSYFSGSGRSNDIIARRFDPNGIPETEDIQLNATTEGNQTEPALAINDAGSILVAWQGPGGREEEDIYARLFDPNGSPLTAELAVNADPNGRQIYPRMAAGADGAFLVVWENRPSDETSGNTTIRAQRFDPNGVPVGDGFQVSGDVHDCRYPDIAMNEVGDTIVVWMEDRTRRSIHACRLDPNDAGPSSPFEVNTDEIASITRPAVTMNAAGAFVITWDGDPNRASLDDIHARCYDPNGDPLSDPFVVNAVREGAQQWPRVAINDANEFVVAWQHTHEDPNLATDIFARRFDGRGRPLSDDVRLNGYVAGKQRYPDIAMAPDGSFLAAWESEDQDGSDYGVFSCFQPALIPTESDPNEVTEGP